MAPGVLEFFEALLASKRLANATALVGLALAVVGVITSKLATAIVAGALCVLLVQLLLLAWYFRDRYGRAYEVVEGDHEWDLIARDGREAIHRKVIRARYLQNHVRAVLDRAWGQGRELLKDYACSPGHPADAFQFGNEAWVLISLREARERGREEVFAFERTVVGGFTEAREWVTAEAEGKTRRLKVRIVFPADRPCTAATVTLRSSGVTRPLELTECMTEEVGRPVLSYEARRLPRLEAVTIHWDW